MILPSFREDIMRARATRLRDILRILSSGEELTIRQIWRKSDQPPEYDVSVRYGLDKLRSWGLVIRVPPTISRGRAKVIWKITERGLKEWESIQEGSFNGPANGTGRTEEATIEGTGTTTGSESPEEPESTT